MQYHVEISPRAEEDIKSIGAVLRPIITRSIRGLLGDPNADSEHFEVAGPWRGMVIGNVVPVFRFMTPDELQGRDVPGRYVGRVLRQDELEEIAADLRVKVAEAPPIPVAAEELMRAVWAALRRRLP